MVVPNVMIDAPCRFRPVVAVRQRFVGFSDVAT
jgi:hypothetical protein